MFIIALFTIAKIGNNLSAHQWIKKWYKDAMECYSAIKKAKSCPVRQHGWALSALLNMSDRESKIPYGFPYVWHTENKLKLVNELSLTKTAYK